MVVLRYLSILLIIGTFFSCIDPNETFTGYLVAKEYVPEHMSNETEHHISYNYVHVPIIPRSSPPPHKVSAEWIWFIANKHQILKRYVTPELFHTKKCGDKVTIKRW